VGVDLGDQWSNYCILGLEGETLAEGQLRTTQEDLAEFFQALNAARVIFEVGTHSPWVQEVICSCGHEVRVANPRLMEGSKRRKRKNDRIDANKLARLGRGEWIRNRCTRCSTAVEKYGRTWWYYEPAMCWWRRGPS
jgi:transposase